MFRLAVFALALTLAAASLETKWKVYKETHKKTYDERVDAARFQIYKTNLQKIEEHNELYAQGLSSFYMGENQFTDMTTDEAASLMNGFRTKKHLNPGNYQSGLYKDSLPDEVDWRTKNAVAPVKNQGGCGSCWAFSAIGAVESAHAIATKKLVTLSEENVLDCSRSYGSAGCEGGYMNEAFQYIIDNKGIDTEDSYPYIGQDGQPCSFQTGGVGATLSSYTNVTSGSEDELQKAVALYGPVSVAIDANHTSFYGYRGGIYDNPDCSSTQLDHGVLLIGYGSQDGHDYWLIKNSWDVVWGVNGYGLMSRNKNNQCGIATFASYPVV